MILHTLIVHFEADQSFRDPENDFVSGRGPYHKLPIAYGDVYVKREVGREEKVGKSLALQRIGVLLDLPDELPFDAESVIGVLAAVYVTAGIAVDFHEFGQVSGEEQRLPGFFVLAALAAHVEGEREFFLYEVVGHGQQLEEKHFRFRANSPVVAILGRLVGFQHYLSIRHIHRERHFVLQQGHAHFWVLIPVPHVAVVMLTALIDFELLKIDIRLSYLRLHSFTTSDIPCIKFTFFI